MFNENFSFGRADSIVTESTSTDISPYTSRCSSPRNESFCPRSQPYPRRDSRFDSWRAPRHPSVTALTAQLEHHGITDHIVPNSPESVASPSDSLYDDGYYDGPDTPATECSDESSDFDPALWDLSACEYSATSSPRPSLSLEAQAFSSYTMRRRQRQALVRLQCIAQRTPDLAMLLEECHPSSLPQSSELVSGRTNSNAGLAGYKIEKTRSETRSRRGTKTRKSTK